MPYSDILFACILPKNSGSRTVYLNDITHKYFLDKLKAINRKTKIAFDNLITRLWYSLKSEDMEMVQKRKKPFYFAADSRQSKTIKKRKLSQNKVSLNYLHLFRC